MKKIIVINGSAQSGKDEIFNITKKLFDKGNYIISNFSSIASVKEKAKSFGWNGEKDDKSRRFLSDLKNAWIFYNDGPFRCTKKYIQTFHTQENFIIFIHIRERTEIKKIVDYYDDLVTTLLIRRPNTEKFDNQADLNVENYQYDYIIENDEGLDKLEDSVKTFLKDIKML